MTTMVRKTDFGDDDTGNQTCHPGVPFCASTGAHFNAPTGALYCAPGYLNVPRPGHIFMPTTGHQNGAHAPIGARKGAPIDSEKYKNKLQN